MQALTTYSVLFRFCFFSNSKSIARLLEKKFEMATQPFWWLSLQYNIKTQFIISLGRLNNCNSIIQKLSRGWGRTLCLCSATGSAVRGSESSPGPAALCYHCCIAAKPGLALCHPLLCLSLLIPGLGCYLHQDCMKPIEIIEVYRV